jgi:hypothetical protein
MRDREAFEVTFRYIATAAGEDKFVGPPKIAWFDEWAACKVKALSLSLDLIPKIMRCALIESADAQPHPSYRRYIRGPATRNHLASKAAGDFIIAVPVEAVLRSNALR